MKNIGLYLENVHGAVPQSKIDSFKQQVEAANLALHQKTGKGNDFLGWVDLPGATPEAELSDIEKTIQKLQVKHLEIFVVIGIVRFLSRIKSRNRRTVRLIRGHQRLFRSAPDCLRRTKHQRGLPVRTP